MPPDLLTERQRRLIDAVLILAVIALAFIVINDFATVFYAFFDILLLFFLAWLLSFALAPLINAVAQGPQGAAGRRRHHRLPRDRGPPARDHHPGLRHPGHLDQRVRPGRARVRDPADERPRGARDPAGGPRAGRGPRDPGRGHRAQPPGVGPGAHRSAPVRRRGQLRHLRQRPDPRDPVDLHRPRPRGHPGLHLPPRAAVARAAGPRPPGQRVQVLRGLPPQPAGHGPRVRPVHGRGQHRLRPAVRGAHDGRSRRAPDDPVLRTRSCPGCRRCWWRC